MAKTILIRLLIVAACLVLVGITAFAVWRSRLAKDVDQQFAAIRAAGLPTDGEEANTYYPSVPDDENAAVKMADAFALMTTYSDKRSNEVAVTKFPQSRKTVLPSEKLDLLTDYCAMNSDALAQARDAVKLPHSRYPLDLSWGVATLLPHLAKIKQLAVVAGYQSMLDPKASASDISTMVGMAHTLDTEPTLVSKLVRFAIFRIAEISLERRLNSENMDDAELRHLEELFAESNQTNQIANGLIGERAMNIQYFRMSYAEMNRLANAADDDNSSAQSGPPLPGPQPFICKFTGFFDRDLRFYLQTMQTYVSLAPVLPVNTLSLSNVEEQVLQTDKHKYYILSTMLLPGLKSAVVRNATSLAQIRSTQTALAIERFRAANGRLPRQLDELVPQFLSAIPTDPFDGQPLRYRRLNIGYVVYSVGSDGQDNGGRERLDNAKSSDKTPYDITFTVER